MHPLALGLYRPFKYSPPLLLVVICGFFSRKTVKSLLIVPLEKSVSYQSFVLLHL